MADDDHDLLFEIADQLQEWGFEVETAVNGAELIDALADEVFDLVITDISMPWMTGIQASHSARYAGLGTPILVITALRDGAIARQVAALGRRARLLLKPFDVEALGGAIDALLFSSARATLVS